MWTFQNLKELEGVEINTTKDERIQREDNWVRRMNNGDGKAFEAMYKSYYARLGHFLLRYLHSQKAAEDVLQNLFVKIWNNRTNLKPHGTLRAYLYAAARNHALNYIEKNKNESHSDLNDYPHLEAEPAYPEETIEYKEFVQAFRVVVQQLPEKRRQIFLLHREDKLTYREIAEVLGLSIKTVETQMTRSIKFLSNKLNDFR